MKQKIYRNLMFSPISLGMMIWAMTVLILQPQVWGQEPPPYQPPAHQTRALQIVSEKLNLPVTSLWIANDTTRHSVYLNKDVEVVEVRSENRDIQEVVFDNKRRILSFDSGEFFDRDPAIKSLRQVLSEKLDVPVASLRILSDRMRHYRFLEKDIREVSVFDDVHGRFQFAAMDTEGHIISFDDNEISKQDRAAQMARYGKLDPPLYDALKTLGPDDTIKVVIIIKQPADLVTEISSPTDEEYETKGRDVIEQERLATMRDRDARVRVFLEPFRKKIEEMRGAKILGVDTTSPGIDAELSREQIETIGKWDEVRVIYKMTTSIDYLLDQSSPSVKAPTVWAQGYTGYGQKVAVIEPDGIDFSNPFLSGQNRVAYCGTQDSRTIGVDYHATKVAGVVASTHNTYKGIAYQATLLGGTSCGDDKTSVKLSMDWAVQNGAQVLNASWGKYTYGYPDDISVLFDKFVNDNKVFIASSAGNCDIDCTVVSPAMAYNVMAIGGYDDHNTSNLADDTMYRFSSYIDPFTHAGKPEIVAPAVGIKTTSSYDSLEDGLTPGRGESGTSLAAPHVAAAAALMIQSTPALSNKPEAIKAILMASAIHNIDGNSEFSDRDGAGALDINSAISVARKQVDNSWVSEVISPSSFINVPGHGPEKSYALYPKSNRRVRIVLTWSVDTNYARYAEQPGAGLWFEVEATDLYGIPVSDLCDPCGVTTGNTSIFEFTTVSGGRYLVNIKYYWFDDPSTRIGLAWSISPKDTAEMAEHKDTDGDGMPDNYETAYGLNPNVKDANSDKDGDGMTNLTEFDLGTPPNQANTFFLNFPLVSMQSIVKVQDIYDLRDAIDGLRASVGIKGGAWTNPRLKGRLIHAVDVEELRSSLTPALQSRGFSVPVWIDPVLTGKVIKADHLTQVRNAVK